MGTFRERLEALKEVVGSGEVVAKVSYDQV